MGSFVSEKIRMKSAARLAAVQATYMIEYGQLPVDEVIKDFVNGEVGRYVIEEENNGWEEKEELVRVEDMDKAYFSNLTKNVHANKEALEKSLAHYLREGWSFERFDGTLRALLLCAAYELAYTTDVDAAVIVKEYVDLAYAFFSKNEPKMVNALLDTIAKGIR
ncbi:MAG: transcription antitermination factor NusB [Alphaproteobacteria bacterium]|nr:transcription antitermination factor NusB [Alphaproteobacteria bacterium]